MEISLRPVFKEVDRREKIPLNSSERKSSLESVEELHYYRDYSLRVVVEESTERIRLESPFLERLVGFEAKEVEDLLDEKYGEGTTESWEIRGYGNGWAIARYE